MWLEYTVGCDEDGHAASPSARGSSATPAPTRASATRCSSAPPATPAAPTRVPNVDVEARAVYTNNPPCGAMRGFGVNQSNFAIEGVLDLLAEQVGIDGWEIRWRNALDVGRPVRHRASCSAPASA